MGVPKLDDLVREKPMKIDDLGVPWGPRILGNLHRQLALSKLVVFSEVFLWFALDLPLRRFRALAKQNLLLYIDMFSKDAHFGNDYGDQITIESTIMCVYIYILQ